MALHLSFDLRGGVTALVLLLAQTCYMGLMCLTAGGAATPRARPWCVRDLQTAVGPPPRGGGFEEGCACDLHADLAKLFRD